MVFIIPSVIDAIGSAVGAASRAFTAHANSEKNKQAAKHYKKINNELVKKYTALEKRYYELADKSKKQIIDLTRQHALDEVEKDYLRLAIRLQQSLIGLMVEIEKRPSQAALTQLKVALQYTNQVLSGLNEELVFIPSNYFTRNLIRAVELEKNTQSIGENNTSNERKRKQIQEPTNQRHNGKQADVYFEQGINCINQGDYQDAILNFTQAIQVNPNHAKAYLNRGYIRIRLGDNLAAMEDFSQALRISPHTAETYLREIKKGLVRLSWDKSNPGKRR